MIECPISQTKLKGNIFICSSFLFFSFLLVNHPHPGHARIKRTLLNARHAAVDFIGFNFLRVREKLMAVSCTVNRRREQYFLRT